MINFNNHNITGMSYNNHTIKKAYGCDGHLVWSGGSSECGDYKVTFKREYGEGQVYYRNYNGNYTLTSSDVYLPYFEGKYYSVNIGKCVNSIGSCALCDRLLTTTTERVVVPDNVAYVGGNAFAGNNNLEIEFKSKMPPLIEENSFQTSGQKIIVPCDVVDRYKAAWPTFKNIISGVTTGCTQLSTASTTAIYDYIEMDDTHVGSIDLGDLSYIAESAISITSLVTFSSNGGKTKDDCLVYDKADDWGVSISDDSIGGLCVYTPSEKKYWTCSVSMWGVWDTMTIKNEGIYGDIRYRSCLSGVRVSGKSNLSFFKGNARGKIGNVKIYDGSTLEYDYVPLYYNGNVYLLDKVGGYAIKASGNLKVGNL